MIAIHKESYTIFKVITTNKKTFSGKVIKSNDKFWSEGEVGYNLDKDRFYLSIGWDYLNKLFNIINEIKYP